MATIGQLLVQLQGDASSYNKALNDSVRNLNNFVSQVQKNGKKIEDVSKQWVGAHVRHATSVGQAYSKYKESLGGVAQGLVDQGQAQDVAQKGMYTLATNTVIAQQKAQQFQKTINDLSNQFWVLSMGLQQAGRSMVAAFTAPLAGLAALSVKTFADWEQGTKMLQASADLTAEDAEKLTQSFRELALVMPKSVIELQEIATAAAEAGVSIDNIEAYTVAIAKLTTISDELDPEQAAETLISISRAFGIAEENVERTASVIRKMAKEARGGMDDFTAAILRALPSATTLNVEFQDLSAILAAIIPVTGTASRAGTQLNAMFDKMSQNLPKLAAQMSITEEQLREMISIDAVQALKTYIDGLELTEDQIEKNNAVLEVFGSTGAKSLRALINQYDEFIKRQEESNEAFIKGEELTNDYLITANTLKAQFQELKDHILEVAKVIGDDLAPIMKKILNSAIKTIQNVAAVWIALPDPIKKVAIVLGTVLAVLGPLILAFNTLISIFFGLFTAFTRLVNIAGLLKGAFSGLAGIVTSLAGGAGAGLGALLLAFGKVILIAAAVVAAIVLIYKALDRLFNITEKIKGALGITAFQKRVKEAKEKINGYVGEIGDNTKETAEKIEKAMTSMALLATEWGDKVMESYLYGFREADFGILDDAMRIVQSYFDVLEEKGELSINQIYNRSVEARRAIAKAITEIKELGRVSEETMTSLEGLVGEARMEAIVRQMQAAVKVEEIQSTIDDLKDRLEDRKDALEKETEIIDEKIEEQKDLWGEQIEAEEDAVTALKKRKRDLERVYKEELRALESTVKRQEEEKEIAEERLEAIEESNDLFIEQLQWQRDSLKENVDETKDTLNELKDLRDDETDAAEGMLDYAKMNLEAARNQLKKEKALGKDEWDASYRAALERTDQAEEQVDLAYANYIKTKKLYKKEEDALEEQLDQQEDQVKAVDKQLRQSKYAAKQQEKIYEEQLDIAEDALDEAKDSLRDFKDAYQEQKDLIQDEIDEHQYRIDDLKDARDAIVDKLEDERDTLEDKYNAEINILEDRIDTAQKSLDATEDLLAQEKAINDQRLQLERERLQAAQGMAGGTEFPGIAAGGFNLDEFNKQMEEATEGYEDMMDDVVEETEKKEGILTRLWEKMKEKIKNINWGEVGKVVLAGIFPPYGLYLAAKEFFGSETWENIKNNVKRTVNNIDWSVVGKTILGLLFPPYGLYLLLTDVFGIDWEKVKNDIANFVKQVDWSKIGKTILGLIFPPYGLFLILTEVFNIDWEGIKNDIVNFVKQINWSEIGKTILSAIFAVPVGIGNLGIQLYNSIVGGLEALGPDLKNVGKWVGETIASGINLAKDTFRNVSNVVYGVAEGLNSKWGEIKEWGKNIGGNIASGVYNAWNNMNMVAPLPVGMKVATMKVNQMEHFIY